MVEKRSCLSLKTVDRYVREIVERVRTERLPIYIDAVIVFGSSIKGGEKPHDLDIILIKNPQRQGNDYETARKAFDNLIQINGMPMFLWGNYSPERITKRLISRGMKKIHFEIHEDLMSLVRCFKDNKGLLKEEGLPMCVVWSAGWEEGWPDIAREKQPPMLPYLKFLRMTDTREIRELNLDLDKIEQSYGCWHKCGS